MKDNPRKVLKHKAWMVVKEFLQKKNELIMMKSYLW